MFYEGTLEGTPRITEKIAVIGSSVAYANYDSLGILVEATIEARAGIIGEIKYIGDKLMDLVIDVNTQNINERIEKWISKLKIETSMVHYRE